MLIIYTNILNTGASCRACPVSGTPTTLSRLQDTATMQFSCTWNEHCSDTESTRTTQACRRSESEESCDESHTCGPCGNAVLCKGMMKGVRACTATMHPLGSLNDHTMENTTRWSSDDGHLCTRDDCSDQQGPDERSGRIQ